MSEDFLQRFLVDRVNQVDFPIEQLLFSEGVPIEALVDEELGEFVIAEHCESLAEGHIEVLILVDIFLLD